MRIRSLTVSGVGGLHDGQVLLPDGPVTAFAGANGTGKSKLLACLLSPWSQSLPPARSEAAAEAAVEFELSSAEQSAIQRLSVSANWGEVAIPKLFVVRTKLQPLVGLQRTTEPALQALVSMFQMADFLQSVSSLNVIYLPAERRLMPTGQVGIDLNQLSELIAWQKTAETRATVNNYGRLDDQEFEQFAKALSVADTLPNESDVSDAEPLSRIHWPEFLETVNAILAPKRLLPLTRQHPDQLRIRTPQGSTHGVQDLSSGERQALIIISRVLRAGAGHSLVIVDEPDAYLHPHLSQRLTLALEQGVGAEGQLIVATHSPSILDSLPPTSIVRLGHQEAPRLVSDEADRVDLYRSAGFRASALTQSDLLLISEGESDVTLLSLLYPDLTRAALRPAGGRAMVLRQVESLAPYELPVLGVVDGDVFAPSVPIPIESMVIVWGASDIEGVFLSDEVALQTMIELGLMKAEYRSIEAINMLLDSLLSSQKDNVIAEVAQRKMREAANLKWPTPRGQDAIPRLEAAVGAMTTITSDQCTQALSGAEELWDAHSADRWPLVRGKYLVNEFASKSSEMRSGRALLEAVARARPRLHGFQEFEARLTAALQ